MRDHERRKRLFDSACKPTVGRRAPVARQSGHTLPLRTPPWHFRARDSEARDPSNGWVLFVLFLSSNHRYAGHMLRQPARAHTPGPNASKRDRALPRSGPAHARYRLSHTATLDSAEPTSSYNLPIHRAQTGAQTGCGERRSLERRGETEASDKRRIAAARRHTFIHPLPHNTRFTPSQ